MAGPPDIESAREEIVRVGHRLWQRGLVGGAEGNVSVRLDASRILTTPSGACKGFLAPGDLLVTDPDGGVLSGAGRPSSELRMHLRIYRLRPDVGAVVHAHPPTATGFAIAGRALDDCVVPEGSRLGPEGAGVSIATHSLEVERCCILASQLGATRTMEDYIRFLINVVANNAEDPGLSPADNELGWRISLAKLEGKLIGDFDAHFRLRDRLEAVRPFVRIDDL